MRKRRALGLAETHSELKAGGGLRWGGGGWHLHLPRVQTCWAPERRWQREDLLPLCEGRHHRCSGHAPTRPTVADRRGAQSPSAPCFGQQCAPSLWPWHPRHPPARAPLTDDDGAGAHQPDLLLERHPLRGAGAGARAGGGRGCRAGMSAPARLLRVAGHVAVPPRPRSLRCPVCPTGRQSVGPSVCPCARRLRSPDSAHRRAHALARGPVPGPPGCGGQGGAEGGPVGSPLPHLP